MRFLKNLTRFLTAWGACPGCGNAYEECERRPECPG